MIVIVSPRFMRWFVAPYASAIALFPFIVLKEERLRHDKQLINHERIHIRQQLELLVVFFYLWYILEYAIRWLKLRNGYRAYRGISFEQEAYEFENDLEYLSKRSFWSFLKKRYYNF